MHEKRFHIRIPVGIGGSYRPINRLAAPCLGSTRDISLGGARFSSLDRMEPGARISMVLSLPKQGEATLTGLVVWSRLAEPRPGEWGYEAGLCWENVNSHAQARLNSLLTDFTHFGEPVVITGGPAKLFLNWTWAISFGLGAVVVLGAVAIIWLRQNTLAANNRPPQAAVHSYQHPIEHFLISR